MGGKHISKSENIIILAIFKVHTWKSVAIISLYKCLACVRIWVTNQIFGRIESEMEMKNSLWDNNQKKKNVARNKKASEQSE